MVKGQRVDLCSQWVTLQTMAVAKHIISLSLATSFHQFLVSSIRLFHSALPFRRSLCLKESENVVPISNESAELIPSVRILFVGSNLKQVTISAASFIGSQSLAVGPNDSQSNAMSRCVSPLNQNGASVNLSLTTKQQKRNKSNLSTAAIDSMKLKLNKKKIDT